MCLTDPVLSIPPTLLPWSLLHTIQVMVTQHNWIPHKLRLWFHQWNCPNWSQQNLKFVKAFVVTFMNTHTAWWWMMQWLGQVGCGQLNGYPLLFHPCGQKYISHYFIHQHYHLIRFSHYFVQVYHYSLRHHKDNGHTTLQKSFQKSAN